MDTHGWDRATLPDTAVLTHSDPWLGDTWRSWLGPTHGDPWVGQGYPAWHRCAYPFRPMAWWHLKIMARTYPWRPMGGTGLPCMTPLCLPIQTHGLVTPEDHGWDPPMETHGWDRPTLHDTAVLTHSDPWLGDIWRSWLGPTHGDPWVRQGYPAWHRCAYPFRPMAWWHLKIMARTYPWRPMGGTGLPCITPLCLPIQTHGLVTPEDHG